MTDTDQFKRSSKTFRQLTEFTPPAFDRLPILAHALQDAGCERVDALGHCRGGGPHVRGGGVVDRVPGKG